MSKNKITPEEILDFKIIEKILSEKMQLVLSAEAKKKIIHCREYLDKKLKGNKESIYGINTGFGALYK